MLKATDHNLKKLETIFKESNYRVRYGKGNFHAGYCILDDQRQIVVNKFYSIEIKMSILTDLLSEVNIDPEKLSYANVGRHALGVSDVGGSKSKQLEILIKQNYPHIKSVTRN